MRLADGTHLTYCTNIHPGESLAEIVRVLEDDVAAVRRNLGVSEPMGLGLRLSARAARELEEGAGALESFAALLERLGLYVFTLNGFPYGPFHGAPVKDRVYLPDWRQPERLEYSDRLARILARLLPEGVTGSISTVPGGYKAHLAGEGDRQAMAQALARHAVGLHRMRQDTGRLIALGLEPEPGCLLETTDEAVAFFGEWVYGAEAVSIAARLAGVGAGEAADLLRRHLGLCLDACHAALNFDDPADTVGALRAAGIPVVKVQLSAGLEVACPGPRERAALRPFAEDTYLHQVTARTAGGLVRYPDLADALADERAAEDWRIHFHVPLWAERLDGFATTAPWLEQLLVLQRAQPVSGHLEVETYTWSVLDRRFRPVDLPTAIVRELSWVRERLG